MKAATLGIIALVLGCALASEASAWGNDGHKIVCRIAFQSLDPAQQAEVTRLTRSYRKPDGGRFQSFPEACVFADEARRNVQDNVAGWERFEEFNNTHFLNVPRNTSLVRDAHCSDTCVLKGIQEHQAALRDASTDEERTEALFFLSHWVGDIHQPLHVSYKDDQGGGRIDFPAGFYPSDDLHKVWDTGIIRRARGTISWQAFADQLARSITPAARAYWLIATPLEWAQESYALATTPQVDYCEWDDDTCAGEDHTRVLGQSYQEEFQDDVETRLQQAAVRLAELIRQAL